MLGSYRILTSLSENLVIRVKLFTYSLLVRSYIFYDDSTLKNDVVINMIVFLLFTIYPYMLLFKV